jgi:RNA polymerase sigma-70 factor (ECF subfamily)
MDAVDAISPYKRASIGHWVRAGQGFPGSGEGWEVEATLGWSHRGSKEDLVMTMSDESLWVTRAREGDAAAFAAIYARYERRIYAFIYRMMGNPDDAFDLTQETFLKAYRALDKTDAELNVNAWLHRIASNACMDVLRRRQLLRWLPWDNARHDRPSGRREDSPEAALLGDETQRAVTRVLQAMSPRNRQALILREYEGLAYQEIAAVLGISLLAVKSLIFRARAEFRERYQALEGRE